MIRSKQHFAWKYGNIHEYERIVEVQRCINNSVEIIVIVIRFVRDLNAGPCKVTFEFCISIRCYFFLHNLLMMLKSLNGQFSYFFHLAPLFETNTHLKCWTSLSFIEGGTKHRYG